MRPLLDPAYLATWQKVKFDSELFPRTIPADTPPLTAVNATEFPFPVALVITVGVPRGAVPFRPLPELSVQIFVVAL